MARQIERRGFDPHRKFITTLHYSNGTDKMLMEMRHTANEAIAVAENLKENGEDLRGYTIDPVYISGIGDKETVEFPG